MAVKNFIKTDLYNSANVIKLSPKCMLEMNAIKHAYIKGILNYPGVAYLLLSKYFLNTNLKNENDESLGSFDCTHLFVLGLCRAYLKLGSKVALIFDNCHELYRFQKLAVGTIFGKEDLSSSIRPSSFAMCKIRLNGKTIFLRPYRYGRIPPIKFRDADFRSKTTSFPEHTIDIPLFLVNDLDESLVEKKFDIVLYVKTKPEYYSSKYPKITTLNRREDRIKESIGKDVPLLVLISDSLCLPRSYRDIHHILFIPIGNHSKKEECFKLVPKNVPHLSSVAMNVNERLMKILEELRYYHEKVNLAYLIICSLYGVKTSVNSSVDRLYLLRTSKNIDVQQKIEDIVKRIKDMRVHMEDLKPTIKNWNDIYEFRKQLRRREIEIECQKELIQSLSFLFTVMYYDAVLYHVQTESFDMLENELSVIAKRNLENLSTIPGTFSLQEDEKLEKDDFDPETPSAYIEFKPKDKRGIKEDYLVDAEYFILESDGKKYIYYCFLDEDINLELANKTHKPLTKLAPGDVIRKSYWDYPTLRGRLLDYIKSRLEEENDQDKKLLDLKKKIEIADEFKTALYSHIRFKSREELQARYGWVSEGTDIKNLLLGWVSSVMQPRKERMFQIVLRDLNETNSNSEFSKYDVLSILKEIKDKRILFKNSRDYNKKVDNYLVVEGPNKTNVEASKIGKIYRYS